jgi:uncharacterized protein (DUF58 family)
MTPTGRALWLLALAALPVLAAPLLGVPLGLVLMPAAVALAVIVADRLAGVRTPLEVRRDVGAVLSVGADAPVEIALRNAGGRTLALEVVDECPAAGAALPAGPLRVRVKAFQTARVRYRFTPARRGSHAFDAVEIAHRSRLGLWRVRRRFEERSAIEVYPNIEALHRFELLARHNALAEIGVRAVRMRGDGTEFERMRDYRPGDDPRGVDWKSTARLGRLIVREMGCERNQNVLFLIDMGRMMRRTTDGLSHFDCALNTAIILGHIATRRGDNVGVLLFSDRVRRFVPLGRGRAAVDAMVRATFDAEPEETATSFRPAFEHVLASVRRRSLLLLMTHLVPGEDRRLIRAYSRVLGRQHLPLCLFFREPDIERAVAEVPRTVAGAFRRAAALDLVLERHEGLAALRHAGVLALDALPGEYSATAISQYLDIKARNLL